MLHSRPDPTLVAFSFQSRINNDLFRGCKDLCRIRKYGGENFGLKAIQWNEVGKLADTYTIQFYDLIVSYPTKGYLPPPDTTTVVYIMQFTISVILSQWVTLDCFVHRIPIHVINGPGQKGGASHENV